MTIKSFKGRKLAAGDVVDVYYNIHAEAFTLRNKQSGLVVAHGSDFMLVNPSFHVSEAGRLRVIAQRRKNVHAHITGVYVGEVSEDIPEGDRAIKYNPYWDTEFMFGDKPVKDSQISGVIFKKKSVIAVDNGINP